MLILIDDHMIMIHFIINLIKKKVIDKMKTSEISTESESLAFKVYFSKLK